jgi:hypothetical protein
MNLGIGLGVTNYLRVPTVALDPDAAIAVLFQTGTPGVYHEGAWYDPSDSSTVWQDAAGTTPAGVGDPVGRIDDKSGNGNHATQTTSAARPVLSARANLITYSEQLNHSDWSRFGVAVSADAGVAPDATTTADLVYATSTGAVRSLYRGGLPVTSKKHRYHAKASGKNWFCIIAESTSAGGVWFDLATGSLGTVSAGWTASIESAGNDWYVCTATSTASFNQYTAIGPVDADNSVTVTASGTDGVLVWGADVRTAGTGSSVPAYQQITDASTYNTVGFPRYLDFDGVDDYITGTFASAQSQPNTLGFGYKWDDAASTKILVDSQANRHTFYNNSGNLTYFAGLGVAIKSATLNTEVALLHFNDPASEARIDGVSLSSGDNLGSSSWGGVRLGASNSATIPADGRIYSFVGVNRTLTAGEISDMESYLADKSGVTL